MAVCESVELDLPFGYFFLQEWKIEGRRWETVYFQVVLIAATSVSR